MWQSVSRWFGKRPSPVNGEDDFRKKREQIIAEAPIPVFWLFGKTGSGKTSIVRNLTGAERATIGTGFRPETKFSQKYAFPGTNEPLIQFLDTRGLGEAGYDPAEDLRSFADETHLMIVTVRVNDRATATIRQPLQQIRAAAPQRPILLAITCLHQALPFGQMLTDDPFRQILPEAEQRNRPESHAQLDWSEEAVPQTLSAEIHRLMAEFDQLVDAVIPLDFTLPEDGFPNPDFGQQRLTEALVAFLPSAYRESFLTMHEALFSLRELHESQATPQILAAASLSATAAAVPLPWIDIPVVAGIQSDLIRRLAALYGQSLDWQQFLQMAGAVGGRLAFRQILRGPLKLIPVLGHAANSALAFAATYGLGEACCWYYGRKLAGHAPTKQELQDVLKTRIQGASELWKKHHGNENPSPKPSSNS